MRVLSYKNATIALCFFNLVATLFLLLRGHASLSHRRLSSSSSSSRQLSSAQLKYIWESEELRRVMEPVDLIKRIKEIELEAYADADVETENAEKQTAAVDLSKRLQDMRAVNEANSQKALEEWRKRKIERARQREIGKNGTASGAKS
ncbi:hypothetical protein LUZ61_020739 [Rhynchospora tenuis]|uniref:Uncharacterized protein n=1 Tax=Rhynchospora tenuis TaxID=198213 RepID=A0AAD6EP29_9POAL|nr:hypothetical protein LUZ61_020739 [Rhynchospora tenuis]